MAISEAQKRARNSWDKKNMIVLSCKLLRDDGEEFACSPKLPLLYGQHNKK